MFLRTRPTPPPFSGRPTHPTLLLSLSLPLVARAHVSETPAPPLCGPCRAAHACSGRAIAGRCRAAHAVPRQSGPGSFSSLLLPPRITLAPHTSPASASKGVDRRAHALSFSPSFSSAHDHASNTPSFPRLPSMPVTEPPLPLIAFRPPSLPSPAPTVRAHPRAA
jgi:hypothetical protein